MGILAEVIESEVRKETVTVSGYEALRHGHLTHISGYSREHLLSFDNAELMKLGSELERRFGRDAQFSAAPKGYWDVLGELKSRGIISGNVEPPKAHYKPEAEAPTYDTPDRPGTVSHPSVSPPPRSALSRPSTPGRTMRYPAPLRQTEGQRKREIRRGRGATARAGITRQWRDLPAAERARY